MKENAKENTNFFLQYKVNENTLKFDNIEVNKKNSCF